MKFNIILAIVISALLLLCGCSRESQTTEPTAYPDADFSGDTGIAGVDNDSDCDGAVAEENEFYSDSAIAYIMFADRDWAHQYWLDQNEYGPSASNADISGEGDYSVSLRFDDPACGISIFSLSIYNGETLYPGYLYSINSLKINNTPVAFTEPCITADGESTLINIYNEWVSIDEENARCLSGSLDNTSSTIIDKTDAVFESIETIEINFSVIAP